MTHYLVPHILLLFFHFCFASGQLPLEISVLLLYHSKFGALNQTDVPTITYILDSINFLYRKLDINLQTIHYLS